MKLAIALCICLAGAFALGQDASKTITYETKAAQIDTVLQQLSKQSGVVLVADQALSREVLLISVKDADIHRVMKEIATVTDATWSETAGEYRLVPNTESRGKEEAKVLDLRTAEVNKMIGTLPADDADCYLLAQQSPATLASIPPGGRVVFSSNPTAQQIAADGVTSDFVAYALQKGGVSTTPARVAANSPNNRNQVDPRLLQPAKVILAVTNSGPSLDFNMIIFDGRGMEMTQEVQRRDVKTDLVPVPALPDALTKPDTQPIELSKVTKDLWLGGFPKNMAKLSDLSPEAAAAVKHPDTNDPLSFLASDALIQRAQECGMQLVADLPDSIAFGKTGTAGDFLSGAVAAGDLYARTDGDWMLLSPGQPVLSRLERANRKALAVLLTAATNPSRASLEDMAAFALAEGHAPMGILPEMQDASVPYLKNFVNNFSNFQQSGCRFSFLALYGAMTPAQQHAVMTEQGVSVRTFSPEAMAILSDIVFGGEGSFHVQLPNARSDAGPTSPYAPSMPLRPHAIDPSTRMIDRTYMKEPTEICGQGYPDAATFGLSRMANGGANGTTWFEIRLLPEIVKDCALTCSPSVP